MESTLPVTTQLKLTSLLPATAVRLTLALTRLLELELALKLAIELELKLDTLLEEILELVALLELTGAFDCELALVEVILLAATELDEKLMGVLLALDARLELDAIALLTGCELCAMLVAEELITEELTEEELVVEELIADELTEALDSTALCELPAEPSSKPGEPPHA